MHRQHERNERKPLSPVSSSALAHVQDASRVVECAQVDRQLRFQRLVRHFMSQVLHGCTSADCTTPTCLSCNQRQVSRPHRPPTALTARALAHFLASQDNPNRRLCPHELKVAPDSLEIAGAVGVEISCGQSGSEPSCTVFPSPWPQTQQSQELLFPGGGPERIMAHQDGDCRVEEQLVDQVMQRRQTKKDHKSLGQNLYDSITMIYSYSKQLPTPSYLLSQLRSPQSTARAHQTFNLAREQDVHVAQDGRLNNVTHDAASLHTSAVTSQAHTQPHHSQAELKYQKPFLTNGTAGTRSAGQSIHETSHQPPKSPRHSLQAPRQALLDGTCETSSLTRSDMKEQFPQLNTNGVRKATRPSTVYTSMNGNDPENHVNKETSRLVMASYLNCDIMDQLKEDVYHHRRDQSPSFHCVVDYDTNRRYRPAKPFVNRSLFYTLSDPETLLRSFRDQTDDTLKNSPLSHLNPLRLSWAFEDWNRRNGALIFDSLWTAIEVLFRPPPELDNQKSPRLKPSRKNATMSASSAGSDQEGLEAGNGRYLSNSEAAHIIMICIHALTSQVSIGWPHTWVQLRKFRSWGIIIPDAPANTDFTASFADPWLSIIDELEYEPAIRLADRLARGIGARLCFEHIMATLNFREKCSENPSLVDTLIAHLVQVEDQALNRKMKRKVKLKEDPGWTVTATFMEWLRTLIIKNWDGKAEVNKWSSVGVSITLFAKFYEKREVLNLRSKMFEMPIFNERIDVTTEPYAFLDWEEHPNSFHIFQYPCLFAADYLVGYLRTINFTRMMKNHEYTERASHSRMAMQPILAQTRHIFSRLIDRRLRSTFEDYFLLDVSRESPLTDTLDQLWGRSRRLLHKPLKVKMGMEEGEVGLDHGGVTYEFFRVIFNEAFNPDKGMFTIDQQTRMTWFQPVPLEPMWKFEMLGLLFSLAVYNGVTLPVTFPLAFYYHMLGEEHPHLECDPTSTDFIKDGWPQLANSFDQLLSWTDGDVEDVFMRSYIFSFEALGRTHDIRMLSAKSSAFHGKDTPLVTNATREEYVKDYITYLTHKIIKPQLLAFRRGFHTLLHPKSLVFFSPTSLRTLIEGSPQISIPAWQAATRYEPPYSAAHPTVLDFWSIVSAYSQEDKRKLLEFVTASDRVPVTGFESMQFCLVRSGGDTEMLPTSSTCFGKLYLPEYAGGREKLERKLRVAVDNSRGFGVV